MYNIDTRVLRSSLGISLHHAYRDHKELDEKITFYLTISLDWILAVMNSKVRNTADAIDDYLNEIRDKDTHLPFIADIIHDEVMLIKKQFILAGFDQRLKYKLITRAIPKTNIKRYAIGMDLEATLDAMLDAPESQEDITDVVNAHPTIEQLAEVFDFTGNIGKS